MLRAEAARALEPMTTGKGKQEMEPPVETRPCRRLRGLSLIPTAVGSLRGRWSGSANSCLKSSLWLQGGEGGGAEKLWAVGSGVWGEGRQDWPWMPHGGGERKRSRGLGASAAGAGIRQLLLRSPVRSASLSGLRADMTGVCSSGQNRDGAMTSTSASVSLHSKATLHNHNAFVWLAS